MRFSLITTDATDYYKISSSADIGIIVNPHIEKTIGNSQKIQSGDIAFKSKNLISPPSSGNKWLAVYEKDRSGTEKLINLYLVSDYETYDAETKLYHYRYSSIQKQFFYEFENYAIDYENIDDNINKTFTILSSCIALKGERDQSGTLLDEKWAFPLFTIFNNMEGFYTQSFRIKSVDFDDTTKMTGTYIPVIFRGTSGNVATSTESTAVGYNFRAYNGGLGGPKYYWADILKMMLYAYNMTVAVFPIIESNEIKVNLTFSEIGYDNVSTSYTPKWKNYKEKPVEFYIPGSIINGENFTVNVGDTKDNNVLQRDIAVNNYYYNFDQDPTKRDDWPFFLVIAEDKGTTIQDGAAGGGKTRDVYEIYQDISEIIDDYYIQGSQEKAGYVGDIIFDGEELLDRLLLNSKILQITKININDQKIASITGKYIKDSV